MESFSRIKRESRVLAFIGLSLALLLSIAFMFIGAVAHGGESVSNLVRMIFAVAGVALFIVFVRGAWMATGGAATHILNVAEGQFQWGLLGKERQVCVADIREIYWSDTDGFTFTITLKDGKRIWLPYIETILPSCRSRGEFLAFLRRAHPAIGISGCIDLKTEQCAAGRSPSSAQFRCSSTNGNEEYRH